MPRNKDRLHLALYARPKYPGTYHSALFVCPKIRKPGQIQSATKHHAFNTIQVVAGAASQPWRYERSTIEPHLERYLLMQVLVAKVTFSHALDRVLEGVPVDPEDCKGQYGVPKFSCRRWVRAALEALREQGVVSHLGEWDVIQAKAVEQIEREVAKGRWRAEGSRGCLC